MTDRPIIFSAPMVRALLDGRKTQTRRLATSPLRRCEVGDRLYVRESFIHGKAVGGYAPGVDPDREPDGPTVDTIYRADDGPNERSAGPWTPSIHMPRLASRLTLIVQAVRVEKLQAIGESDAQSEGLIREPHWWHDPEYPLPDVAWRPSPDSRHRYSSAVDAYQDLWESLHGVDSWAANPDVLVLTFRVEPTNIDRLAE